MAEMSVSKGILPGFMISFSCELRQPYSFLLAPNRRFQTRPTICSFSNLSPTPHESTRLSQSYGLLMKCKSARIARLFPFAEGNHVSEFALKVEHLTKSYGNIRAVDDISFAIKKGSIFCFVGPNGAGKTTTMEIIEGLKRPDSGTIEMLDMPMPKEQAAAKELIGVQLQTTHLFERLKVGEVVNLFRSFYQNPAGSGEVISAVSLESKVNEPVAALSGGQQQRLALALALVNDPELVFLDEPTTGLDPQARRDAWRLIHSLKEKGKTVFLTTHYMDEAERLSDEVAIIDHGRIIAHDSPRNLIMGLSKANVIEFTTEDVSVGDDLSHLAAVAKVNIVDTNVVLYTADVKLCMSELLNLSQQKGFELRDMQFRNPSLEDVFIELTGRMLRD